MKNADYWKQRFTQLEAAQNGIGFDSLLEIEKQYNAAQKELEGEIALWYQRFAANNGISMSEARQWLTGKDLKEFKWSVQEYIKAGQENAISGQWMKELENASAKFHISRLEALKLHTQQSLTMMYQKQLGTLTSTMHDVFQSGYYHTAYELQKGFGIGFDVGTLDQAFLEKVLVKPWAADGYNFSERIWKNKDKLIQEVHTELSRNIMTGGDPQKAIDAIAKKMNTSKHNAGRLVMTEEAYFSSRAQKECFHDLGVEEYEIVATLDSHTSEICQGLDGQHFPMSEFEPGVTAPPFHVNCRSTTAPYFPENFGQIGQRAARDGESKQTYYVPEDVKYKEWKEAFVDGDKSGFEVSTVNGTTNYTHPAQPEPTPPPKKQYLTEKKLASLIADADVQIEDLNKEFEKVNVLYDYDTFKAKYNGDYSMVAFDAAEEAALKSIGDQIEQLEAQKAEWQQKLDEKLIVKQKKALTKQKAELQAKLDQAMQDVKTYSGIWKDDVTTADWSKLNIQGKKDYFENQIALGQASADKLQQFSEYLKQLDELDTEGKALHDIQSELKKVEADLTALKKGGTMSGADAEAFTQARKDAALWAKTTKEADNALRGVSGEVWRNASAAERHGLYDYTSGSGKFNRPLSGFEKPWAESGSGWESKYFKGVDKVWIDYEGAGDEIRAMTDAISRSTYDIDCWFQRGCDGNALESFLGLSQGTFTRMSEAELQQFIGAENRMYGFTSCGVSKGKGFSGKPIIINMYAPKGTQMMYAEPFSAFGNGGGKNWDGISTQSGFGSESEIIIQRGAYYRITKIEKSGGTIYIDMEVHPEKGYDLIQQNPADWKGSTKKGR